MKTTIIIFLLFIFSYAQNSFSYEILDEGTKIITSVNDDGVTINHGKLDYIVLSVRGANIVVCDNHPEQEICEWERYYFETNAYPFIKEKKKEGYFTLFASKEETPDIPWWNEEIKNDDLIDGVLVLYKGLSDKDARIEAASKIAFNTLYN